MDAGKCANANQYGTYAPAPPLTSTWGEKRKCCRNISRPGLLTLPERIQNDIKLQQLPGPLQSWPKGKSPILIASQNWLYCSFVFIQQHKTNQQDRMRKKNLAPIVPLCFCRCPKHPSECKRQTLERTAAGLWTSLARPPGSSTLAQVAQAQGQAKLGLLPEPLRQWTQQAVLLAREVSAFRSPGDREAGMILPLKSQIPLSIGPSRTHVRLWLQKGKRNQHLSSVSCPYLNPAQSLLSPPFHRGGRNETPGVK